jgi:hypothetical protein
VHTPGHSFASQRGPSCELPLVYPDVDLLGPGKWPLDAVLFARRGGEE